VGMSDLSTAAAALPAGSTTLDARAIAQIPIASHEDIFRLLPGFEVSNYGQGAIGYGLSMRGYTNTEHGQASPITSTVLREMTFHRVIRQNMRTSTF
jgi:hypothetical protein